MNQQPGTGSRRYLKSREKPWAQSLAAWVCRTGVTPNTISVLSIVFSVLAAVCLMKASDYPCKWCASWVWAGAAVFIQLRLLCNLLDGMVAIEGGKKSAVGGLYNEVPDRIADPLLLMAAGYCNDWVVKLWGMPLGWIAAVLALGTAYIRVLGGTLTGTQSFIGPMAKQHRMAVLTLACLGSIVELWVCPEIKFAQEVMRWALALIVAGSVVTCWRRLRLIAGQLRGLANFPPSP
ncbi:MAG: CDP-alcohol phosphatidyltransferase [Verrucomicrobiaceae bacterium]|nr:CDP-alcohol phosphatidyltransferase [Verrucomicrobiaceae bacterium]